MQYDGWMMFGVFFTFWIWRMLTGTQEAQAAGFIGLITGILLIAALDDLDSRSKHKHK